VLLVGGHIKAVIRPERYFTLFAHQNPLSVQDEHLMLPVVGMIGRRGTGGQIEDTHNKAGRSLLRSDDYTLFDALGIRHRGYIFIVSYQHLTIAPFAKGLLR
jgi:hypothetical protein